MKKTTRPIIRIHNLETDEIIDREMNDEEFAAAEEQDKAQEQAQAEEQAKAETKAALLDRLGISEDEAKLLLS
jgi:hypothetical protein